MILVAAVLAGLSWFLATIVAARADTPIFPDIQRIVERGTIVVALLDQELPPFLESGDNGTVTGFDVELARLIATNLGVEVTFHRTAKTFDDVVDQVARGEADIATSFLSRTPHRAKSVHFTNAYVQQGYTVLLNRRRALSFGDKCPGVAELVRLAMTTGQVGVVAGSSHAEILRDIVPEAHPRTFASTDAMLEALYKGEILASLQGELSSRRFLHDNPSYRIQLKLCEIGKTKDDIAIAVRPDAPNLTQYINILLAQRGIFYDIKDLVYHEGPWDFRRQ